MRIIAISSNQLSSSREYGFLCVQRVVYRERIVLTRKPPKLWGGPRSYNGRAKVPKGAGLRTRIQHEKNKMRTDNTMQQLRTGWNKMFEIIPGEMRKMKIKTPGSYDPSNCHAGKMWGWPRECNMTDKKAERIMFMCYQSKRLTENQLKNVRKTLSYAYELCGGDAKKNWPSLKGLFVKAFNMKSLPKGRECHSIKPRRIPTPEALKRAFTKQWTPKTKMPLTKWAVAYVAAYDWGIFGCRSKEDLKRLKYASRHVINVEERWQASEFYGGRCKLCGNKKGTRPWWVYRVCLCPGQHHISPPKDFGEAIDEDGNPNVEVRWNTACPVACWEFYTSMMDPKDVRCYPKWVDGRYGKDNVDPVVDLAIWWFEVQGEMSYDGRPWSTNAGRKALARWCQKLNISYSESFEIHGDLYETWADHYEDYVPKDRHQQREQSKYPDKATRALCRFANWLGRGKRVKARLSRHERYMHHHLMAHGEDDLAHRIAHGLPSDEEMDLS